MPLLLSSVLATTFIISCSAAKKEIISINEEMFMTVIKDTVGFMEAMNDTRRLVIRAKDEIGEFVGINAKGMASFKV